MNRKIGYAIVALALAIVMSLALVSCQDDEPIGAQGVTNLDSLHLSDSGATATPVLRVNQDGAGALMELLDGGTPAVSVYDGGNVAIVSDLDVDGTLNVDAIDLDGAVQIDGELKVGVAGTGYDVYFYSDTSGDHMMWDQGDEQLVITGTNAATALDIIDGNVAIADDLSVDSTTNLDEVDVDGATDIDADVTHGTNGTGYDFTWYSDTSGDLMQWDADDEALVITGTNAATALDIIDGNVAIADDLSVDSTTNLDEVDIDGTVQIDAVVGIGVNGTSNDIEIYSGTSGDYMHWDSSAAGLVITGTNAQDALTIPDGNLSVTDDFSVDGTANLDATDIDGNLNVLDDFTFSANNLAVAAGSVISPTGTQTSWATYVLEFAHGHASAEAAVQMGVIPANANVVDVIYVIDTQWNDGSSAVVDCGISGGDVDAFVDNHDINDAADINRMGDNADMPYTASLVDVGGTAATIICQVDEGNVDASAGAATIRIFYIMQ